MAETEDANQQQAAQAQMAAAALAVGKPLGLAALGAELLAIWALLSLRLPLSGRLALLGSCICGLVAAYYALRTHFDEQLFAAWSRRWEQLPHLAPRADLEAFDHFLGKATNPSRLLAPRIQGAIKLLRRLLLALTLQFLTLLAAAWCWPAPSL